MEPYRLIQTVFAHDGPIRSVAQGPTENEIITGCQADSPNIRRWRLSKDLMEIEEIGSPIFHDHWVTAVTCVKPSESLPPHLQKGCIITGCMDSKIRVFDVFNNLIGTLEGHQKGVISFSWLAPTQLISGGWDGVAILWDLTNYQRIRAFGPHENGVHVLGLSNGIIATTSTGESVNSQPANFQLRFWNAATGQLVGNPIKDHLGSIRSIAALPGVDGFITTSNDGSVIMRSIEGDKIETLMHPLQDDGGLPFVLDCNALDTPDQMGFISSGEDGSVVVWQGTEMLQSIPHPNTIWVVLGWRSDRHTGDFVTGGQDGILRVFSKAAQYQGNTVVEQLSLDFLNEVHLAKQAKRNGPTAEDLAKAPKWENRGQIPGKSEHQIMVFNRENNLIAAEWANGSWVYIGEVTGQGGNDGGSTITANDSGVIDGVHYDHVFPVEIETPQGLKNLQLGFNNLENPFQAAQRFIDANGIGQYYLQQIADWIIARGGGGGSGNAGNTTKRPTNQQSSSSPLADDGLAATTTASFTPKYRLTYFVDGFAVFNDVPNATKVLNKLKELNETIPHDAMEKITDPQFHLLEKLFNTLENTSYYHSSQITSEELVCLMSGLSRWSQSPTMRNHVFIFFDMMRLIAIHPNCIELFQQTKHYPVLLDYFQAIDHIFVTVASGNYAPTVVPPAVLSTMIRSLTNFVKNEMIITTTILGKEDPPIILTIRQYFAQILLRCNHSFYLTIVNHKFTRLSMITLIHNLMTSLLIHKSPYYVAWYSAVNRITTNPTPLVQLLQNVLQVITTEKEMLLIVFRAFQVVNTVIQYRETVPTYPSIEMILEEIRSPQGKLYLTAAQDYWKQKENNPKELMQCFDELLAV